MTEADSKNTPAISAAQTDPREAGRQLRPGLWDTINERYPRLDDPIGQLCAAGAVAQTAGRSTADLDQFLWRACPKRPSARCVARDVTEAIKAPRDFPALANEPSFWSSLPSRLQIRVLFEALKPLETATESGTIRDILIRWAEVRREAKTLTDQGRNL